MNDFVSAIMQINDNNTILFSNSTKQSFSKLTSHFNEAVSELDKDSQTELKTELTNVLPKSYQMPSLKELCCFIRDNISNKEDTILLANIKKENKEFASIEEVITSLRNAGLSEEFKLEILPKSNTLLCKTQRLKITKD